MSTWTNFDGLDIDFGLTRAEVNKTGNTAESIVRTLTVDVDWTDITAAASHIANINVRDAFIPAGAFITKAVFNPTASWTSGGAATLTIGLGGSDGSTVIDADGIDATVAIAALTAAKAVDCDGALVNGTAPVGAADAYVYFTTGTAAWTAGAGRLVIEYITDGA